MSKGIFCFSTIVKYSSVLLSLVARIIFMSDETKKHQKSSTEDDTTKKNRSIAHTRAIMHLPIESGRLLKTFRTTLFGSSLLSLDWLVFI